ncbi:MAG TPA: hypothetical protein ENN39_11595 [Desulfonatronum sp.]|nr:hypothetical protein [Desulfonatronum sp.]
MKFPLRIYGEVHGLDPDKRDVLSGLPETIFHIHPDRIEVEYEGSWLDIDHYLDVLAAALSEHGQGHVDYLDHDNWEIRRYRLQPGTWTCKRIDPDNVLEPLLKE